MLGELTGEEEPDGGLDLAGGDSGSFVVVRKLGSLGGDPLEDVIDEGVHDAHGLGRDSGVGMNLLQDFVDVSSITLFSGSSSLNDSVLSSAFSTFAGLLGGALFGTSSPFRRL